MSAPQTFRELTNTMQPQDPHGDGKGLRFETGEHGGDKHGPGFTRGGVERVSNAGQSVVFRVSWGRG